MKIWKGIFIFLAVLSSLGANDVGPTKSELEAMYGVAAQEVDAGRYGAALKQLDAIDARQPEMAAAKNLRGVALMRLAEYGPAEKALQKARELDPELWEARFNLAEIPFLRKNWAEARHRFEGLAEEKGEAAQGATGDLIQFKIMLTWLLQGKETQAAEILARLQESSASPAFYCGKAAFAFRHKDDTEARVALKAAEKSFSAELFELFRESFYEVGWLEKSEGGMPVTLEVTSPAERLARARNDFGKAERAYRKGDYEEAVQLLDAVDAAAPNQAVSYNLRGEVLLAEGKAAEAETALRNALAADPQFAEARYNLARVPFRKGDYDEARKQLEALLGATAGGAKERQREHLIRYQIFLTLLREGRDAAAQKAMDEFKMMDDSPALYYAQAAWAFQHGNFTQGKNWVANANNLYASELNRSFAAPFADLGWMQSGEPKPTPSATALAEASPVLSKESSPPPVVAESTPAEPVATPNPSAPPAPPEKETPAPVVAKNEPPPAAPTATPEESATPKKVAAANEKRAVERETSETGSETKKSKRRSARAKSENDEEPPRRKPVAIEIRRAVPVNPASLSVPSPAAEGTPERQDFGAKVARVLLYPFKFRKEEAASPVPNGSVPRPGPSATPTPAARGPRNN